MIRLLLALIFFVFQKLSAHETDAAPRTLYKHRDDSSTWELQTDNHSLQECHYHEIDDRKENVSLKIYGNNKQLQETIEAYQKPYEKRVRYLYNEQGLPSTVIKANGVSLNYTWNANGELLSLCSSDESIHYTYEYSDGYLCAAENHLTGKRTLFTLDDHNRTTTEFLENGLKLVGYFNERGQRTKLILPDSSSIAYEYSHQQLCNIQKISPSGSAQYNYTYHTHNEWGQVTSAFLIGGLGMLSFRYDDKKRCQGIDSTFWKSETEFDEANVQTIHIQDDIGSVSHQFFYDSQQQLIHEASIFEKSYAYDEKHNLIYSEGQEFAYNELYQLQDDAFQYDRNGNLVQKGPYSYHYDALDRLTVVASENERIVHTYDPFDRRVATTVYKKDNDSWSAVDQRSYIYDGCHEIGFAGNDGEIKQLRVLGTGLGEDIGAAIAIELNGEVFAPLHDHKGSITCLIDPKTAKTIETYRYSAFGERLIYDGNKQLSAHSLVGNEWGFRSKRHDREDLIFFGKRYYDPTTHYWITPDPAGSVDSHHPYQFAMNNPLAHQDYYGLYSVGEFCDDALTWAMHRFTQIEAVVKNINKSVNPEGLSLLNYIKPELASLCRSVFENWFLLMVGFWKEPISTASYGQFEISDKVRITSINGILNLRKDCVETAQLISRTHGGVRVHYIHRPTEGFSRDLLDCLVVKLGYTSPAAHQLAEKWKELIQEMGGTDSGGKILHYAHSIGGTDTMRAKNYMTPEELKMIEVIAFGSATIIPDKDFLKVTNYISWRDGVPYLDPFGYMHALVGKMRNAFFLGTPAGIPMIDHTVVSGTYGDLIHELGTEFVHQTNKSSCPKIPKSCMIPFSAPVAQPDRVPGYEPGG